MVYITEAELKPGWKNFLQESFFTTIVSRILFCKQFVYFHFYSTKVFNCRLIAIEPEIPHLVDNNQAVVGGFIVARFPFSLFSGGWSFYRPINLQSIRQEQRKGPGGAIEKNRVL